jgi:hypothetical protein
MVKRLTALAVLVLAAGCQQAPPPAAPPASAPPTPASPPPVVSTPAPAPAAKSARVAVPSLDFPPGPLYFCESSGGRKAIEYEPRVEQLCRRHPEMGPCQYERDQCRARGGRVYTARNEEVTVAVEAEYDRVVRRVRFQGDSGKK